MAVNGSSAGSPRGRKRPLVALGFAALALGLGFPQSAYPDGVRTEYFTVASGKPALLISFYDCRLHNPWQGTAFVDHGTVSYKETTEKRCGGDEPVRQVWYTSPPGYKGEDAVIFPTRGNWNSTILKITVH
jgi:hypothetical protein